MDIAASTGTYIVKYIITGATGFVGINLTKRLLDMGEEVVIVDSLSRAGSIA